MFQGLIKMPLEVTDITRAENLVRSYHTYFYYDPNLTKLADLIDDDCEIAICKNGKTTSYTKQSYIELLEEFHSKLEKIEPRFHTFKDSESNDDGYLISPSISSYQTGNGPKGYGRYSVMDMQKFLVSPKMKMIFIYHDYFIDLADN